MGDLRSALAQIYKDHPELLDEALNEGKNDGIDLILGRIEKSGTPLYRWTYGIAKTLMDLTPTLNGGFIDYLPADMENTDVRFYYPPQERLPLISFIVKPL